MLMHITPSLNVTGRPCATSLSHALGSRALIPLSIANSLRKKNTKQKPGESCYIPCEGI